MSLGWTSSCIERGGGVSPVGRGWNGRRTASATASIFGGEEKKAISLDRKEGKCQWDTIFIQC